MSAQSDYSSIFKTVLPTAKPYLYVCVVNPIYQMKIRLLFLALLLGPILLCAQKATVSGYLRDAANGETLIGATVQVKGTTLGTTTNEYGFYALTLEAAEYTLVAGYLGFANQSMVVDLRGGNVQLNLELEAAGTQLTEIVVTAEDEEANVRDLQMSVAKLDMSTMTKMPSLLGEVDVLRSIQLLPGVTTVGEGAAGFNVRGGSIDQNLVILDEAPVYNSSHLFGFFSVFNPDAVKGVQLYKGGIPARYGGRLSSILDVRMREGNNKELDIQGGIGTILAAWP
ncbi:MAG: TonB-dependent receptor plug domain-containing protein [Lewinella sp.]|nr:TonB-dependent receptor plug domain-containing protein [Lewinella sp.]